VAETLAAMCMGNGGVCAGHEGGPGAGGRPREVGHDGGRAWRQQR
jgi:hypothetical protein